MGIWAQIFGSGKPRERERLEAKSEGSFTERMRKGCSRGGDAKYFGDVGVLGFRVWGLVGMRRGFGV